MQILADTTDRPIKEKIVDMVDRMERLSTKEKRKIIGCLEDEVLGYGAIQPYLNDDSISEIMINGLNSFFVERKGVIENKPLIFESTDHLMQLIYRIAAEVGREINQSRPILDARLSDGSRVNVILNPVAIGGPIVTIRKFNKTITCAEQFVKSGTFTDGLDRFMLNLVKSRYNLFISGGTGTGKTTLLNYIAQNIPREERIITIEDAAEIDIEEHPHVVAMEMRNSNQKDNVISISQLIKNALRMRPDRIIVGEVRGEEVVDMLQAMNTGHEGSISTGHANSPLDMLIRMEIIASGFSNIDHVLIRKQIISAIDIVIHLERHHGRRRIAQIVELEKDCDDYKIRVLYDCEQDARTRCGEFEERLKNRKKYQRTLERSNEICI